MIKKLKTTIDVKLARTGGMYYIRIPKETVDYYGLELGDVLKVELIEAREGKGRSEVQRTEEGE